MLQCGLVDAIGIEQTRKENTMLVFDYPSKKELKTNIGKPLRYIETSIHGNEYLDNGILTGANRPHITRQGREFYARVTMRDGLITKVD